MSHVITIHDGHAAINVKVQYLDVTIPDTYTEEMMNAAYEACHAWFWWRANEIAQVLGYGGVFAEGRSGGWLVPYYPPNHREVLADMVLSSQYEREKFLTLRDKIGELLAEVPSRYTAYLEDIIEEERERKEQEHTGFRVAIDMWYL